MTERRHRSLLVAVAAVGLAIRLVWIRHAAHEPQGLFDPARYLGYGQRIADGEGMVEWTGNPTAYYPPGYPWFVGIVTWLSRPFTDRPWEAVAVVQAVLGAATCLSAGIVARRLAGPIAGLVAASVMALYPNLVFHTAALLGETLFNFLFMAFLVVATASVAEERRLRRDSAAGLLLGLAILVRPISAAVIPAVALARWVATKDLRKVLAATGAVTVAAVACVLPWTIRNQIRMDAPVAISTNTGDNLCIGHNPDADGAFTMSDHCAFGNAWESADLEVSVDDSKTRYALRRIVDEPGRQPWLLWRRAYFIWIADGDHDGIGAVQSYYTDRWMDPDVEDGLITVADRVYWVVAVVGAAGLVRLLIRRGPDDLLVAGSTIMIALVPLAFFGDSRFKVPVIPLLVVTGAVLVAESFRNRAPAPDPEPEPSPDGAAPAPHG